jgi:glutamine synthetase
MLLRDANGKLKPFDATDTLEKPCYDYKGLSRASVFLDELTSSLRAVGVDVYQIDHEDANGQFEVNYTYADALTSADNFTLVKMAVSEIARKHGMIGTFMPKPFSNRTGSGAHFHISMGNATTKNLFHDPKDPQGAAAVGDGVLLPGRHLARARTVGHLRAHREPYKRLRGGRALGCHLGAGVSPTATTTAPAA